MQLALQVKFCSVRLLMQEQTMLILRKQVCDLFDYQVIENDQRNITGLP